MSIAESKPSERYREPFSSWEGGKEPPGYFDSPLSAEAAAFYREQGFVVVKNALSPDELEELKEETVRICRGERGEIRGLDGKREGLSDEELIRQYLCIHFPHKISPVMRSFIDRPAMAQALTALIGPNVKCMQSMLFIKAAGKPGQAWHQDEFFIPTRDRSLAGGWIAMDDATVENGCLWAIPGSHRRGVLYPMEPHGDFRFDCAKEARSFPFDESDEAPLEMKAGSMVFFNGYLLHRSLPNRAERGFRRSLVNHYMSAESTLPWTLPEGHQSRHIAQVDVRDIVMVAGEDPYAWKGIDDRQGAHVRPSGEGGCGDSSRNAKKARPEKA